jgi:hypothetical protein
MSVGKKNKKYRNVGSECPAYLLSVRNVVYIVVTFQNCKSFTVKLNSSLPNALCEEADFGALNFQHSTKVDARENVQLTTEPAFLQNRC